MQYEKMKSLLNSLENPVDKLEMLMDFGAHLDSVPDNAQCTEILGCTSRVEICRVGNKFYGRADSAMVRGVVAVLLAMIDGKSVLEIKKMDLAGEFASLNLALGAGRLSGLNSMISFLQNL
ncbi:MAG: SufE family protein [Alphaproteobacteria bacterium]|nr:SufE family protein [Alphaproteobacteria bacterium]